MHYVFIRFIEQFPSKLITPQILLIIVLLSNLILTINAKAENVPKKEYCEAFEKLVFYKEEDVLRRWEKKEIRILLLGEVEAIEYAKILLNKFGELSQKKIIYTSKDINIGIIFTEELYKVGLKYGDKYFGKWFKDKTKMHEYLAERAKKDSIYLIAQDDKIDTRERVLTFGMFETINQGDDIEYADENKSRINSALTNILFPRSTSTLYVKLDNQEEIFSPLSNEIHFPLVRLWYNENLTSGMPKSKVISTICN